MRKWLGGIVLVCLLAAFGYVAKGQITGGLRLGSTPAALESRWRTEEEWIVDSIVRDLAEMARFARDGQVPRPGEVEVNLAPESAGAPRTVTVDLAPGRRVQRELPLTTFIWSPSEYRGLASDLLRAVGACSAPQAAPNGVPVPVLSALTDLRPAVVEESNDALSAELARRFCDPAAHEAAALVLTAFTLREAEYAYSDIRGSLNRLTAHLALAGALRPDEAASSLEGKLASVALHHLAGRGLDAARQLDALDAQGDGRPEALAWRRALRLRLTQDTRTLSEPPGTLLERRELYRARVWSIDAASAVRYAEELGLHGLTDAWRVASEAGLSVEVGNVLLGDALERELAEAQEVGLVPPGASDAQIVAALNQPAERCLTSAGPRVIGHGAWAAFIQRHLLQYLWRRDYHTRYMLSLHDHANRLLGEASQRFGKLTLFPMVEVRCSLDARRRPERFDDLVNLTAKRPELIPAFEWGALEEMARYEVVRRGMPTQGAWFTPGVPRGTTFDVVGRPRLRPRGLEPMRAFWAISPQSFEVSAVLVGVQFRDEAPLAELERIFGDRSQYDLRALNEIERRTSDLDSLLRIESRKCALSANHCFSWGYHLVEKGDFAAAAAAYERGLDGATDRILAANSSLWLVNHYLDRRETARARRVAEDAAGTGSFRGLMAESRFLERTGDFEGAERILHAARERYGDEPQNPDEREQSRDGEQDEDQLVGFYYRMAFDRKQPDYERRFHELSDDEFPQGLERLDRAAFIGRPSDGVFVLDTSFQSRRAGLQNGDIIVGLDGFRVRTRRQYFLVRTFTDSPDVSLLVFRHPDYVEVKGRAPGRRLGFDMRSHKPVAGAGG